MVNETENTQIVEQKPSTIQGLLKTDWIAKSAERTLGARGQQFLTSVLTLANSNNLIGACEPYSLYNACLTAATLDLPLNQNLGFAYIVPYKNNKTGKNEAQFQMGYKGFVQLAIRSGKFSRIGANEVYEGQLVGLDDFTGEPIFNFNNKLSDIVVGYMAYFELTNGFRKASYMTIDKVEAHAKKYSQSYKKGFGVWKDNFEGMGKKTVLKLLISKFAPLSTQMEQALIQDQKTTDEYVDNKITFDVENAAIEGELIEPENLLDEHFDDPISQVDVIIENTKTEDPKITQGQMKKAFAITNNLNNELKDIAEAGRLQLFGDKSRKDYTREEANRWIEYLENLEQ